MHSYSRFHRTSFILLILITLSIFCQSIPAGSSDPGFRADINLSNSTHSVADTVQNVSDKQILIHFFFNPDCGACQKVHPFIDAYQANHSEVKVMYYSLENNMTNIDKFLLFQQVFNITKAHIPILFLGNKTLMGEKAIEGSLNSTVEAIKEKKRINNP